MNKESFKTLLEDLYNMYNPQEANKIEENQLIEKYNGREYDAVHMTILKYNNKNSLYHDPKRNELSYVQYLINEYDKGNRVLIEEKEEQDKKKEEKPETENIKQEVDDKFKDIDERLSGLDQKIEKLEKNIRKSKESGKSKVDDIPVEVNIINTEEEVDLPNKYVLLSLGENARFITKTQNGNIIGLRIKDILLQNIDTTSIEITVEKE